MNNNGLTSFIITHRSQMLTLPKQNWEIKVFLPRHTATCKYILRSFGPFEFLIYQYIILSCQVWSSDTETEHNPPTDIVMKGKRFFTGDDMKTVLLNNEGSVSIVIVGFRIWREIIVQKHGWVNGNGLRKIAFTRVQTLKLEFGWACQHR